MREPILYHHIGGHGCREFHSFYLSRVNTGNNSFQGSPQGFQEIVCHGCLGLRNNALRPNENGIGLCATQVKSQYHLFTFLGILLHGPAFNTLYLLNKSG
jgi:hypothetical protein